MDDLDFEQLVESWIAEWDQRISANDRTSETPSIDAVSDFDLEEKHELLWRFVETAYKADMPSRVWAVLAAGPVEDLLAHYGEDYIERVEELARKDPRFRDLLGGVWRNSMTDDVWNRVNKTRITTW